MTFVQAKKRLDKMTKKQFDKYGQILAKLHKNLIKFDKPSAEAIELAFMAMGLYCKK